MAKPQLALAFWVVVQDCLVQFHKFSKSEAAEKVTDLQRRLGNIHLPSQGDYTGETQESFDELIYHSEPWNLACNLAGQELPLDPNRTAYQRILEQNHLA